MFSTQQSLSYGSYSAHGITLTASIVFKLETTGFQTCYQLFHPNLMLYFENSTCSAVANMNSAIASALKQDFVFSYCRVYKQVSVKVCCPENWLRFSWSLVCAALTDILESRTCNTLSLLSLFLSSAYICFKFVTLQNLQLQLTWRCVFNGRFQQSLIHSAP